ncbi:hypothetical protein L6452_36511 [Arctium lappa]|uniref:Uncharacterized protein n=1 Tax=Arctium lappa TaxID=4217 RepID=A0ACB8Y9E7_ARCLA|nr:hypothetical protein L6452_36511 [Arctium lappa]
MLASDILDRNSKQKKEGVFLFLNAKLFFSCFIPLASISRSIIFNLKQHFERILGISNDCKKPITLRLQLFEFHLAEDR